MHGLESCESYYFIFLLYKLSNTNSYNTIGTVQIRVFLAKAGTDVVRIKVFLAISKCAFARALLAHFAVFVTCALPKVASRAQKRCFAPYFRPSVSALESYKFIL